MADIFQIYQDNINTIFGKISKNIESVNLLRADKADSALQEAEDGVNQAGKLLKNIEIHIFTSAHHSNNSPNCAAYISTYKTEIENYKKRIAKARENIASAKNIDSLLLTADATTSSSSGKEKLIPTHTDEIAWSSFEKLEKAKRTTIEMENIGIEIMRSMDHQTEQMKSVGVKLNEMNGQISTSSSLLSRMMRRQHRNKVVLILFGLGMVMTFFVILYFKLAGGPGASN